MSDGLAGLNAVVDKVLAYRSSRKNKKTKKAAEKAKPKNPNRKKP